MKRGIAAALLIAALAAFGGIFRNTVELTGADMAMDAPMGWLVMTREDAALETSAAMFGMTADEAVQFMEENDFYLVLYEPKTGAEIYVTMFGSVYAAQLKSLGQLTPEELELAKEDVQNGYPEWIFDSGVTAHELGDFTYFAVTMHLDKDGDRMDNRQLFTVYDGREIYIDLYANGEELLEEQVAAQDALAASLQVERAMQKFKAAYNTYVAVMVGTMIMVLIQFVGLALTMLLHVRMKME